MTLSRNTWPKNRARAGDPGTDLQPSFPALVVTRHKSCHDTKQQTQKGFSSSNMAGLIKDAEAIAQRNTGGQQRWG